LSRTLSGADGRIGNGLRGNLQPFGLAPGTPPFGVQIGQDLDIYGLRTQYSF
jgi:hypothetical protein